MRILVVEDERSLNELITKRLKLERYFVDNCFDGQDALSYLDCAEYDAVVLDVMLPKLSGIDVLRKMRSSGDKTPVLLLTAKDTIEDRVKGLDSGADDYMVKPFSFDELLARIRVMLRRTSGGVSNVFSVADLVVDCDSFSVKRGDKNIVLSAKEFAVLEYLIRNRGIVLSRDKISHHIWNYDYEGSSNVIDVYIRYLRKKIDENFDNPLIHTIRGVGYVLKSSEE